MIGPLQRHERDMAGAGLDAARRLLAAAEMELRALAELRAEHPSSEGAAWSMEQLIHGLLITWLDEQIDAGVLTEELVDPDLDRVLKALARLEALRVARSPS